MPILSKLAKLYLSIPASSASSERAFSRLNLTVTDSRNRLDPETIVELISYQSLINKKSEDSDEPAAKRIRT